MRPARRAPTPTACWRRSARASCEVARAVGRGLSNADISAELHLSVATVKAHVSRLLEKLDVDNRVQVALLIRDAAGG